MLEKKREQFKLQFGKFQLLTFASDRLGIDVERYTLLDNHIIIGECLALLWLG